MGSAGAAGQNVIVLVFDAWSACNIPLYGYGRDTAPNLARLAKRAVVYHNHYAGGNFTTPGTASLLTGTLPCTHRTIRGGDAVAAPLAVRNIFGAFRDYYRIGYTHNRWANVLLEQASDVMNELVPPESLMLGSYDSFIHGLFAKDDDVASVSWSRYVEPLESQPVYSLFYSGLHHALQKEGYSGFERMFPRGLPAGMEFSGRFLLETALEWIGERLSRIGRPFVGYFHLLPPHGPYNTRQEFYNHFKDDGFQPVRKPESVFTEGFSYDALLSVRTDYDEFILYVDEEFGRFYDALETAGLLENTWVVLTSDHGEMFERGLIGHWNPTLYQPVVRIPLLIFEPGREVGMDVYTLTSAVDVLPTLAQVTGHPIPDWTEGRVLPPYSGEDPDANRGVYAVQARKNQQYMPLRRATAALVKGHYKVIYFLGYAELGMQPVVKMYDIGADPEELVDLSLAEPAITAGLLEELKKSMAEADRPYAR